MSFHDPLTGVLNRYAMEEMIASQTGTRPLGVVYCDISGLKTINDSQGHAQGDQMILSASQLLAEHFPAGLVYRIGGDEFLAVCFDDSRESFQGQVDRLLEQLQKNNAHLAVGAVWSEDGSTKIKELARQAENEMYRNKQQYYLSRQQPQNAPCPGPGCEQSSRNGTLRRPFRRSSTTIITTPRRFFSRWPSPRRPTTCISAIFRTTYITSPTICGTISVFPAMWSTISLKNGGP